MQIVEDALPDRCDRADATRTGSKLITRGDRRLRDRLESIELAPITTGMSGPRRINTQTQGIDGSLNLDEEIFSGDDQPTHTIPSDVRVSVVIPARNEARNLAYVFSRLPAGLHQVILVDGHSTDGTIREALRLRPDIEVIEQTGRGKGDALSLGFTACTGDVIVMIDADGSTDPREIPRFVAALYSGADFVKGSRYAQGGGSSDLTPTRKLGNTFLCWLVNSLYATQFTDLCYGYNAFWHRCLPYIRLDAAGFDVETLINVRVARAGLVIQEVPSFERPRLQGMSNLRAVRDGLLILRTIVLERLRVSQRRALGTLIDRIVAT